MRKNYDFWSFFVIPALTFLMTAGYELTATNFSVIGNREGRRGLFLLWGGYRKLFLSVREGSGRAWGMRGQAGTGLPFSCFRTFSLRRKSSLSAPTASAALKAPCMGFLWRPRLSFCLSLPPDTRDREKGGSAAFRTESLSFWCRGDLGLSLSADRNRLKPPGDLCDLERLRQPFLFSA